MINEIKIPADLQNLKTEQVIQDFTPHGHDRYLSALSKVIHAIQGFIGEIELDGRSYSTEQSITPDLQRNWGEMRTARQKEIADLKERLTGMEEIYRIRRAELVKKTAERTLEKAILEIAGQPIPGWWGSSPSKMDISLVEIRKLLTSFIEKKKEGEEAQQQNISEFRDKLTQIASRTAAYLEQLTVICEGLKKEDASAKKTTWPTLFFHHYKACLQADSKTQEELQASIKDHEALQKIWDAYQANDKKIREMLMSMQMTYQIPDEPSKVKKIKRQFSAADTLLSSIQALHQEVLFHKELGCSKAESERKLEELTKRVAEHQKNVKERTTLIQNALVAYGYWDKVLGDSLESAQRKFTRLETAAKGMDGWVIAQAK